jgi:hypothetical protein
VPTVSLTVLAISLPVSPWLTAILFSLDAPLDPVAAIAITQNVQEVFVVLVGVDVIIRVGTLVALGVIAIVLGDRATRHSDFSDSPRRAPADRTALNS